MRSQADSTLDLTTLGSANRRFRRAKRHLPDIGMNVT
jgi:hypothetical protein